MKRDLNLAYTADRLGIVNAEISDRKEEADELKAVLIEAAAAGPERAFEGSYYRATVSFAPKRVVDHVAVYASLVKSGLITEFDLAKLIVSKTKVAENVPSVRVSALKA